MRSISLLGALRRVRPSVPNQLEYRLDYSGEGTEKYEIGSDDEGSCFLEHQSTYPTQCHPMYSVMVRNTYNT